MLTRKLLREMLRSKWQYLAVCVLITLGVGLFGGAYMSYLNLDLSYRTSYDRLQFEDFGVQLRGAPDRVVARVARIPGVKAAEGRLVEDVAIELPGRANRKMVGRLVTVPVGREAAVNQLVVPEGRPLTSRTAAEILLESGFAKYHNLHPGDLVKVNRAGTKVKLRIVGIVKSPEYIYVVQSKQQAMPSQDTFGVMFVSADTLGPLVGKTGQINEIKATVWPGSNVPLIMHEAKQLLAAYNPEDPVERKDQPSNTMLEQDLHGFRVDSVAFPMLFLGAAGITIYTLLTRLVHMQRGTIGLMRALGFTRSQVIVHYLGVPMLLGVAGSAFGSWLGLSISNWLTGLYVTMIAVPYEVIEAHEGVMAVGCLVGILTCIVSGWVPATSVAKIGPAEALRPPAPQVGRVMALDQLIPFAGRLPLLWRIPIRNLLRQPRRTLSSVLGIAAGLSIVVTAQGMRDSVEDVRVVVFDHLLRSDLQASFVTEQSAGLVGRVQSWPGVFYAEGVLQVPVDFQKNGRTFSGAVEGVPVGSPLTRLEDEDGQPTRIPSEGVVVGQVLRKKFGLRLGDTLQVSLPRRKSDDKPRVHVVRVSAFMWGPVGSLTYMPVDEVRTVFGRDLGLPPNGINGIRAKVDPSYSAQTKRRMLDLPGAAAVQVTDDVRAAFEQMLALMGTFTWVMLIFGSVLAFGIVFTMVTVNILERTSEVATLRTIGVGHREISGMVILENMLMALLGVAVGLPMGRAFVEGLVRASTTESQSELVTFRVVVYPASYAVAALLILVVVLVSQWPAVRQVNRLDLARATKERAT